MLLLLWSATAQVISAIYPVSRFQYRVVYQERIGEPLSLVQRNRLVTSWIDLPHLHWLPEGVEQRMNLVKDKPEMVQEKYRQLMATLTKATSFEQYLQQIPTSVNQLAPDLMVSKLAILIGRPWLWYGAALGALLASLGFLFASLRSRSTSLL